MASRQYLIFLDRDGTLIRHIPYLCNPDEVELLPGVKKGILSLVNEGHLLFLHTNQSGVGRGYFPLQKALDCNARMIDLLGFAPSPFTDICVAPEHPDDEPIYRKPSPKFALEMARRLDLPTDHIIYFGDAPSDLITAKNAGGQAIGLNTGDGPLRERLRQQGLDKNFPVFDSFEEAVHYFLSQIATESL